MNSTYKVLIVDDSKAMCRFLKDVLERDEEIEVVGEAQDPYEARDLIKQLSPDVITLDVEMPRMDGITFLKNLMRLHPIPVIMISSLTAAGAKVTLDALNYGAVDFMVKRHPGNAQQMNQYISDVINSVKSAARVDVTKSKVKGRSARYHPDYISWEKRLKVSKPASGLVNKVIAVGASTGGPEAVRQVMDHAYSPNCAVVISQHMPERFISAFAERLNLHTKFNVKEVQDGDILEAGCGYVAPGDRELEVRVENLELVCRLKYSPHHIDGKLTTVDTVFNSIADALGSASVGVLLTGMGSDGAIGLKKIRDSKGLTFAQDERSSAVWGMPGSAVKLNAVDAILPLQDIGPTLKDLLSVNAG